MNIKKYDWESLPFAKYIEIAELEQNENELENVINLITIIFNKNKEEVEKMSITEYAKYSNNLNFLTENPDVKKSKYKWEIKDVDKITVDDFINFELQKENNENIPSMLSLFSTKKITEKEILEMGTLDVLKGFFFLNLALKKSMAYFSFCLTKKMMKEMMKQKLAFFNKKKNK